MREILNNMLLMLEKVRQAEVHSTKTLLVFAVLLAFGALNCVLGYRLLRFWMMLFGFASGAAGAFYVGRSFGDFDNRTLFACMAVAGIILALISFFVYKAGIFLAGAGLGTIVSIYLIHPTSSAAFFLCMLAGTIAGMLALKFSREIIIIGTSLLGGVLAGFSLGKLFHQPEIPYGLALCIGFSVIGLIVQFMLNKPVYADEEEAEEEENSSEEAGEQDWNWEMEADPEEEFPDDEEEEEEEIEWTDEMDDQFWRMNRKK